MQTHLMSFVRATPVNIIAWTLGKLGLENQAGRILDHYEEYLKQLNDPKIRSHLGIISPQSVYNDKCFLNLQEISHQFQRALDAVFFEAKTDLSEFMILYGVF